MKKPKRKRVWSRNAKTQLPRIRKMKKYVNAAINRVSEADDAAFKKTWKLHR